MHRDIERVHFSSFSAAHERPETNLLPAILYPSWNVYANHIAFIGLVRHHQIPLLTNPNFALQVFPFCSKTLTQILISINISKKSAMHTFFEWNYCLRSTVKCDIVLNGKHKWEPDLILNGMIARQSCAFRGKLLAQSESFLNRHGNRRQDAVMCWESVYRKNLALNRIWPVKCNACVFLSRYIF